MARTIVRPVIGSQRLEAQPAKVDWGREQSPGVGEGWFTPLRPEARRLQTAGRLLLEERGVLLDELFLVLGHIFERMNRVGGAGRNACAAINAALGINVHLRSGFETRLVLLGMNAIGWADLNTKGIFNAGISNYVGHDESISWNEHFHSLKMSV